MSEQATTRRAFLDLLGRTAGGGAVLKAMTALGIATATSGCGSASGSSGSSDDTPPAANPAPPDPGNNAGASTSPTPSDWPTGVGNGQRVIILGAGIAGMTAIWELRKLGYDCTVLEAQPGAGGRCRTIRSGDVIEEEDSTQFCEFDDDPALYFNPGPARIPHHHEFILGYCREFGVEMEVFTNDNRATLLHSRSAFGGNPQLSRRVMADTRGHIASLLSQAADQGALDQQLSADDRDTLRAMLQEFGDLRAGGAYQGSDRAGFRGQEKAGDPLRDEPLQPLALDALLDSGFWQSQLDHAQSLQQQPTMLQPVGGMDHIARAFEARVSGDILYEAVVGDIRSVAGGVEVTYTQFAEEQVLVADYCICTIPATVLRSIDNDFSTAHRSALDNFRYSRACKIAFQSRRFWEQEHNIYGGISWTDQDITQLWYPSARPGTGDGVVQGAYTFSDAAGQRFAERSPQQRLDACAQQADRLHTQFSAEVERGVSVSWPKVPYQMGAWGVSDPGVLRQADGQVYFAGEHLSDLQGWQEGAVQSAYLAIDAIVQRNS